jgi:hypothetical protein
MRRTSARTVKKGAIDKFLVQDASKNTEPGQKVDLVDESESVHPEKMAPVSNADLKELLLKMEKKMDTGFAQINERVDKLAERVERIDSEVEDVKTAQKHDRDMLNNMEEELANLRNSLLLSQVYSRKYHLLLYGVTGYETTPHETIKRVRKFAEEDLKLEAEYAKRIVIRNAHRLQKRDPGPTPIIVVFLLWEERNSFLKSAKNLAGTKMSVRTDLPPILKQKRGELASKAYEIRRDENIQARIQERGVDIYIETRRNSAESWTRRVL